MRRTFSSPLARWGFTVCAAAAIATAQPGPFLVSAVLAAYAWRCRR
ncbi:hypothetical protein [Streptomyces sp. EKS3.2]